MQVQGTHNVKFSHEFHVRPKLPILLPPGQGEMLVLYRLGSAGAPSASPDKLQLLGKEMNHCLWKLPWEWGSP